MRGVIVFWAITAILSPLCSAEPRWCTIAAHDASNKIYYPPIAKAARVYGIVLARVVYVPNGAVENVDPISGPAMLRASLSDQLLKWPAVRTDAPGSELCETLVIADFRLHDSSQPTPQRPTVPEIQSILRLSVDSEIVCLCDPGAEIHPNWKTPFLRFGRALKRGVAKIFGHSVESLY